MKKEKKKKRKGETNCPELSIMRLSLPGGGPTAATKGKEEGGKEEPEQSVPLPPL